MPGGTGGPGPALGPAPAAAAHRGRGRVAAPPSVPPQLLGVAPASVCRVPTPRYPCESGGPRGDVAPLMRGQNTPAVEEARD